MSGVRRAALIEDPRAAAAFGLALAGSVLWPVHQNWRTPRRDSFPLSYYPMFSARRSRRVRVTHLVAVDAAGNRRVLDYRCVGRGGLNQVRKQIRRTVERGEAGRLCALLAAHVERQGGDPPVVAVAVVTGEYRLDRWFAGERTPVREVVHARLEVACAQ